MVGLAETIAGGCNELVFQESNVNVRIRRDDIHRVKETQNGGRRGDKKIQIGLHTWMERERERQRNPVGVDTVLDSARRQST